MSDLADLRKRAAEQSQTGNYWAGKCLGLIDRLTEARQALWDVYGILGFDTDGDTTPDALKHPLLTNMVRDAAREFRQDYDDVLDELPTTGITLTPDGLDGGWVAEHHGLPGCISEGDTPHEALENVMDAFIALARVITDTGERHTLEKVMADHGFTQADLDTVEDE